MSKKNFPCCAVSSEDDPASARRRSALVLTAGAFLVPRRAASAEWVPFRPVRVVVPYGPGGLSDVLARIVAERLRAAWPQPVVVENQPGAGGNIGAAAVARASPDGHTLLIAAPGPLSFNRALYTHLAYDPTAFVSISTLLSVPSLLAVGPSIVATDLTALIAAMRQEPERFTYASNGLGSTPHLTAELFSRLAGVRLRHIPYSSEPQAMTDVVAGRVDLMFPNVAAASNLVQAGRLRVLAVADAGRSDHLPTVPTMAEAGLDGLVSTAWFGLAAPPRTAPGIVEQIAHVLRNGFEPEEARRPLVQLGGMPIFNTPAQARAFSDEERLRWSSVIRQASITLD